MDVKEAINYLRYGGINMTSAALRSALRKNIIVGLPKENEKGNWFIPESSLRDYILQKTKSPIVGYNLGKEEERGNFRRKLITYDLGRNDFSTFLLQTMLENDYHFLVSNFTNGYNHFYIRYDQGNNIIHLIDELFFGGTSAINWSTGYFIEDILFKIHGEKDHELTEKTVLLIYTCAERPYGGITYVGYNSAAKQFDFGVGRERAKEFINKEFLKRAENNREEGF